MQKKTVEDYLLAIFQIYEQKEDKNKGIQSIEIAKQLNITKPSVSSIIRKLSERGYLKAMPYSPVFLTDSGLKEAKRIIHNHRVIEYFLREALKCDMEIVHDEAHKLEHAFSETTIRKLDHYLGNPKISPYGKRIH